MGRECPYCNGFGWVPYMVFLSKRCKRCKGTGWVKK